MVFVGIKWRTGKIRIVKSDFLPEGKYKMVIAYDKGRKEILMDTKTIKSKKSLNIKLLSGGGYLARFERI